MEYQSADLRILARRTRRSTEAEPYFNADAAAAALRFHRSLPAYAPTPLLSLSALAAARAVRDILVKDESRRFGLKAFKGLGGSYAMFRVLCEKLSLDPARADFGTFLDPALRAKCAALTFAAATDGNHGRGISWAAKLFGCRARIYMPAGSAEARRRAIESAGSASAEITPFNYDRTVDYARTEAGAHGWILLQDTAWAGYTLYPRWIIQGYLTLAAELFRQLGDTRPTHVFLQAGVGAMAGGMAASLLDHWRAAPPAIAVAESAAADCIFRSARIGDGAAHSVAGDPVTIMAGLNCGTPCPITWPILRDRASFYCACGDAVAEAGMRLYARPMPGDAAIVSGESGAVTLGLVDAILGDAALRKLFRMGSESTILLLNTEGDTDPAGYARVLGTLDKVLPGLA